MHPQITEKKIAACGDLIRALEECHASFVNKFTGGCNQVKHELGLCLGNERKARAARNREESKLRKQRYEASLKSLYDDD